MGCSRDPQNEDRSPAGRQQSLSSELLITMWVVVLFQVLQGRSDAVHNIEGESSLN